MDNLPLELESMIFDSLEAQDLVRYAKTSRLAFERVSDFIYSRYSVCRLLRKFFKTEEGYRRFREAQRRFGVLVSGSQVTGLFSNSAELFKDSDLDVYVSVKGERGLEAALEDAGYRLFIDLTKHGDVPQMEDSELLLAMLTDQMILRTKYVDSAIASVKEYHNEDGKVIQVIASHGPPMDIIFGFHSTCVMNVIGYNFAYCLYPFATVCAKKSVVHIGSDMNSIRAREKWQHRGWEMVKESTSSRRLDLRTVNRFVGDRYCWRFPCERKSKLSDISANEASRTVDVLGGHSWQLLYPHDDDEGFYAIYAWLMFPSFAQYMCISNRIMRKLETVMLSWSEHKFAKYVQKALTEGQGRTGHQ